MRTIKLLILCLVPLILMLGCKADESRLQEAEGSINSSTKGSTGVEIDTDDNCPSISFESIDEVSAFINNPDVSVYDEQRKGYYLYIAHLLQDIGYIYSPTSSQYDFKSVVSLEPSSRYGDGGIGFFVADSENIGRYYSVSVLSKQTNIEYSGKFQDYYEKRFGSKKLSVLTSLTAKNDLGEVIVLDVDWGDYFAYIELDDRYYLEIYTYVTNGDMYVQDHSFHLEALEAFVNSLMVSRIAI